MRDLLTPRATTSVQRLSVVADSELMEALQTYQRKVEQETGLRLSLSQVAGALMRTAIALALCSQQAAGRSKN